MHVLKHVLGFWSKILLKALFNILASNYKENTNLMYDSVSSYTDLYITLVRHCTVQVKY